MCAEGHFTCVVDFREKFMQMSRAVISSLEVFVTVVVSSLALVVVAVSEVIVAYVSAMARFMLVLVYNPRSHFDSTSSA